jgi:DNA-binding transcriptional LysR family regulator
MFPLQGLDPELLRAFQLIADGESFTHAAHRLGRTQSAISMQIKRLEEILGHTVLSRGRGGGITLTPHGRYLLTRAREILALNDEVIATFRAPAISGTVSAPRTTMRCRTSRACCGASPRPIRRCRWTCCARPRATLPRS